MSVYWFKINSSGSDDPSNPSEPTNKSVRDRFNKSYAYIKDNVKTVHQNVKNVVQQKYPFLSGLVILLAQCSKVYIFVQNLAINSK